ncbi:MAG: ArsR/SmtB family transcription factor [Peptococcaceae bacterium]
MPSAYQETAKVFKAFCDENRLKILELLRTGEKCACRLLEELHITQPTLSHHMKLLCDADIVQGRKEGKWVYYSINPDGAKRAEQLLAQLVMLECSSEQQDHCCSQ